MARKYKLTWQRGTGTRSGRWKKFFRGKYYYFDGGRGKTDNEAYQRALDEWRSIRDKLEEEHVKPHQQEYEAAISEWTAVLTWANRHDDQKRANEARENVRQLERRLAARHPKPLEMGDRFIDRFEPVVVPGLIELLNPPPEPADLDSLAVVDPAKLRGATSTG